jgi:hypothetical protein
VVSYRQSMGRWERSPARQNLAGLSATAAGRARGYRCGRLCQQGARSHRGRGAQLPTRMADQSECRGEGQGGGHGHQSAVGRGKSTASLSEIAAAAHEGKQDAAASAGGTSLPSAGGTHEPRSGVGEGWRAWCITGAGADSGGAGLTHH